MTKIPTLNEQSNKVYLACLELGSDTIQNISKKAGIPRSTCYLIIDELKNSGLVHQIKKSKKTFITAESPTKLVKLLEEKKKEVSVSLNNLNKILPELSALHNTRQDKPSVRFYEGFEGIKNIMEDTLVANEILVICSGYDEEMRVGELSNYLDDYFEKVDQKKIKTLEILGEAPDLDPYVEKYQSELHQMKIVLTKKGIHHIDKMIYGNQVAIVSFEYLNGVVLENKEIAEFERDLFYRLWKSLK